MSERHSVLIDKNQNFARLSIFKDPLFWAAGIPFLYWFYLAFHTEPVIVFDALWFVKFGSMIHTQGWVEFLRTGPHNEPLLPFLISISMRLSEIFSIPFYDIQKVFHIGIFFLTQLLTIRLLKELKINRWLSATVIFYFGVSPAMVNAIFSLWSEIVALPVVPGIVLAAVLAWKALGKKGIVPALGAGLLLGSVFAGITFVKGLFQFIFLGVLAIALIAGVFWGRRCLAQTFVVVLAAFITYQVCVLPYMFLNLKYNGHFAVADRGPWIVYGKAAKRAEALTPREFSVALSYAVGEGFCKRVWSEDACLRWSPVPVDNYGLSKMKELQLQGLSGKKLDAAMLRLGFEKMREHPIQYALLSGVEGFKLMFWESTKIGFVVYPGWLQKFYDWPIARDGLRLIWSIATFAGVVYLWGYVWKNRRGLRPDDPNSPRIFALAVMAILFTLYIGMYSMFFVVPRHVFPIVSLYLVAIAFMLSGKSILRR